MKGKKAILAVMILTAATCSMLIGTYNTRSSVGMTMMAVPAVNNNAVREDIPQNGIFPGSMYYEYADDKGIYYTKYNNRRNISFYNVDSGTSKVVQETAVSGNYIHAFIKNEQYSVWEEDNGRSIDSERQDRPSDWKIYISKNGITTLVDEGKPLSENAGSEVTGSPASLSLYEDYLAYKSYDKVPGTSDNGIVIKLYDIKKEKLRAIFSIVDVRNIDVSDPGIYKNYIVWSTMKKDKGEGSLYLYSIKHGSYIKIAQEQNFINPVIWEDYIVCTRNNSDNQSIVIYNFNSGFKKDIVSSDNSLSPGKELHDYSIGEGYVTWNNSYADSVSVYDIVNDKVIELKMSSQEENKSNNLLNIRIFGKRLLYTDHTFDNKTGSTLSEVNRYIDLK